MEEIIFIVLRPPVSTKVLQRQDKKEMEDTPDSRFLLNPHILVDMIRKVTTLGEAHSTSKLSRLASRYRQPKPGQLPG